MTEYIELRRLEKLEARVKDQIAERAKDLRMPENARKLMNNLDNEQLRYIATSRRAVLEQLAEMERIFKKEEMAEDPSLHQEAYTPEQMEQIRREWELPPHLEAIKNMTLKELHDHGARLTKRVDSFNATGQVLDYRERDVLKTAVELMDARIREIVQIHAHEYDQELAMEEHGARGLGRHQPSPQPLKRMLSNTGAPSNRRG